MNKIEFLCLFNRFANKSITANNLYEELLNIDTSNFDEDTLFEFNKIKDDIKKLMDEYPIIEDDYVLNQRTKYNFLKDDKNNELIDELINEEVDSLDRWNAINNYISNNSFINNCISNLSNHDLLKYIAMYKRSNKPLNIDEYKFNELVKTGINENNKEALLNLMFNYREKEFNFYPIIEYYISIKDIEYIFRIIQIFFDILDINFIFSKINDKNIVSKLLVGKEYNIKRLLSDKTYEYLVNTYL